MSLTSKKRRRHARLSLSLGYHLPRLAQAAADAARASESLAAHFATWPRMIGDLKAKLYPLVVVPPPTEGAP